MNDIDAAFGNYLIKSHDKAAVNALIHQLRASAYIEEAVLLYRSHYDRAECTTLQENPWRGGRCYLGEKPPPLTGDPIFWFDPIECALMRSCLPLEDTSPDMAAWVSIRPVQRWQFRGFLSAAELGRRPGSLPFAVDAFQKSRFKEGDSQFPQTDIYEEEAWGYAAWFGKSLASRFQWESISHSVDISQIDTIFDRKLHFWESGDFRESFRLAYSQQSLSLDPIEQADYLEEGGDIPSNIRVVYREYDRLSNIGFSTCILANRGLLHQLPRLSEYYELRNQAVRSIS